MKAIMISIKPKYVAMILNGEKTKEIRKKFLKDYKGWVYIYVTKDKEELVKGYACYDREEIKYIAQGGRLKAEDFLNGKVVARFYCDNVEDFGREYAFAYKDNHFYEILEKACINTEELGKYYQPKRSDWEYGKVHLYAIHISQLEVFDKPKELSEFRKPHTPSYEQTKPFAEIFGEPYTQKEYKVQCEKFGFTLTKAPQNYCYVEVE